MEKRKKHTERAEGVDICHSFATRLPHSPNSLDAFPIKSIHSDLMSRYLCDKHVLSHHLSVGQLSIISRHILPPPPPPPPHSG